MEEQGLVPGAAQGRGEGVPGEGGGALEEAWEP